MDVTELRIRGGATSDELAALLALLARTPHGRPEADGYTRWRRGRLAALRRDRDAAG